MPSKSAQETDYIVRTARVAWSYVYGPPQNGCSGRADKGIKRKRGYSSSFKRGISETRFITLRRKAAVSAAGHHRNGEHDQAMGLQAWTEAHTKEKEFLERKVKARKVQALAENSLALHSQDLPELQESLTTCKSNFRKNMAARIRAQQKANEKIRGRSHMTLLQELQGSKAVMAASATANLQAALQRYSVQVLPLKDSVKAQFIVTNQPGNMPDIRHQLLAALHSWYEVSPDVFTASPATSGTALKLDCAASAQRVLIAFDLCTTRRTKCWSFLRGKLASRSPMAAS